MHEHSTLYTRLSHENCLIYQKYFLAFHGTRWHLHYIRLRKRGDFHKPWPLCSDSRTWGTPSIQMSSLERRAQLWGVPPPAGLTQAPVPPLRAQHGSVFLR